MVSVSKNRKSCLVNNKLSQRRKKTKNSKKKNRRTLKKKIFTGGFGEDNNSVTFECTKIPGETPRIVTITQVDNTYPYEYKRITPGYMQKLKDFLIESIKQEGDNLIIIDTEEMQLKVKKSIIYTNPFLKKWLNFHLVEKPSPRLDKKLSIGSIVYDRLKYEVNNQEVKMKLSNQDGNSKEIKSVFLNKPVKRLYKKCKALHQDNDDRNFLPCKYSTNYDFPNLSTMKNPCHPYRTCDFSGDRASCQKEDRSLLSAIKKHVEENKERYTVDVRPPRILKESFDNKDPTDYVWVSKSGEPTGSFFEVVNANKPPYQGRRSILDEKTFYLINDKQLELFFEIDNNGTSETRLISRDPREIEMILNYFNLK